MLQDPSKVRGPDSDGSLSIPARALHVTWGNDPRYWEWLKLSDDDTESEVAGFEEGAMLQQVNWLEVRGELGAERLSVGRSYKVYYVMKFDEDAFGWSHAPIYFKVKLQDEAIISTEVMLQRYGEGEEAGKWHKVCVGEFKVVGEEGRGRVEVGMFETKTQWWKGGMILAGIRLHPI